VHEDGTEAAAPWGLVFEEKTESRRSGFDAPHLGHSMGSLSLAKTICSNWCLHFGHENSYSGIVNSLCFDPNQRFAIKSVETSI
jgi:hypothetical protein